MNDNVKALVDLASLDNPDLLNKEVFKRLLLLNLAHKVDLSSYLTTSSSLSNLQEAYFTILKIVDK